jgi:hypothetical protein
MVLAEREAPDAVNLKEAVVVPVFEATALKLVESQPTALTAFAVMPKLGTTTVI